MLRGSLHQWLPLQGARTCQHLEGSPRKLLPPSRQTSVRRLSLLAPGENPRLRWPVISWKLAPAAAERSGARDRIEYVLSSRRISATRGLCAGRQPSRQQARSPGPPRGARNTGNARGHAGRFSPVGPGQATEEYNPSLRRLAGTWRSLPTTLTGSTTMRNSPSSAGRLPHLRETPPSLSSQAEPPDHCSGSPCRGHSPGSPAGTTSTTNGGRLHGLPPRSILDPEILLTATVSPGASARSPHRRHRQQVALKDSRALLPGETRITRLASTEETLSLGCIFRALPRTCFPCGEQTTQRPLAARARSALSTASGAASGVKARLL